MGESSLQAKVNQALVLTLAVVVFVGMGSSFAYSYLKSKWTKEQIAEDLSLRSEQQINELVPSFYLPEQKEGVQLILSRIKTDESLDSIYLVDSLEALLKSHKNCRITQDSHICESLDGAMTIFTTPIQESGETLGYLVKEKVNSTNVSSENLIHILEVMAVALFITFALLFWILARLMSKEIPASLQNLLQWVEADLKGHRAEAPELQYKELIRLRKGISEILDRHDKAKDQAVIGQITSGVMHDIKTPLSSVVMATGLVKEQRVGSAKRQACLEILYDVCEDKIPIIGGIIETVLDGSREIHIEPENACVRQTIEAAISMNSQLVELRRAKIETFNADIFIEHDPLQFQRVLANLIKNSIEAAQSLKRQPCITIECIDMAYKIIINIEDNGPGISTSDVDLFRIFRSTKPHGCGLGLMVSQKIVEAHKGRIEIERSERLGGAKFQISIPVTQHNNLKGNEVVL